MTTFILLCYFIFCVCFWHIWSFPIFFCCSAGERKNRFSPRTSDYHNSASMYTGKLICGGEKFPFFDRKPTKHQNYVHQKAHFENFFHIIYMKSRKSCNFPQQSIIISRKMNEWMKFIIMSRWQCKDHLHHPSKKKENQFSWWSIQKNIFPY